MTFLEDFNRAIKSKNNFSDAYFERSHARAHAFWRQNTPSEGVLKGFTKTLTLNPNFSQALYMLSGGSLDGDAKQQKALLKVLQTDPNFAEAFCSNPNTANCNSLTGDGAIENYTQVIWLNPNFAQGYSITEFVRLQKEKAERTIAETTQSLPQNSKDSDTYYRRGTAYLKLRRFQEAIQDFTQAIQLNPKDADAYAGRGFAYLQTQRR